MAGRRRCVNDRDEELGEESMINSSVNIGSCEDAHGMKCVISNLLTYVQHYSQKCTVENFKKVVCRFYAPEEIYDAKSIMWNTFGDEIIGRKQTRQKSMSREAYEADTSDIITAIQKLDQEGKINIRFVQWELDRIPKFSPEESDQSVSAAQVSQHEQRIAVLENQYDNQASALTALQIAVKELMQKQCNDILYADKLKQNINKNAPPLSRIPEAGRGQRGAQQHGTVSEPRVPVVVGGQQDDQKVLPDPPEGAGRGTRGDVIDDEGFQHTNQQLRNMRRREELNKRSVFGKRQDTSLIKSGAKYCDLFVFKIHSDVSENELKTFIEDSYEGEESIKVVSLKLVSHIDSRMKSFHVKIESKDREKLMSEEFWPNGIGCRDFINNRRFRSSDGRLQK